jgi:hypothetical protein
MASLHSPSLRRRLDTLTEAVREKVRHREKMREYAKASASIRAALAEANIDPAQNSGLRHFAYAERVVSEWPDSPELQQADAEFIAQDPQLASSPVSRRPTPAPRPSTGTPGRWWPALSRLRTRVISHKNLLSPQ